MTNQLVVRPRSLGEIFDDAWRIYLANAPLLLALTGLVYVPCVIVLLMLLTQAWPWPWVAWVLAGVLATLLPLSGVTSGACQEIFHCWAEKQPTSFNDGLRMALRRWVNHVTAQALMVILPVAGILCLFSSLWSLGLLMLMAYVPFALMGIAWHAVLTGGQKNVWKAYRYSRRCAARHLAKAVVIVVMQVFLLLAAMLNLHLFLTLGIWAADELAGLDLGFLALIFTVGNPCYVLLLAALVWWLLAPHNEAVNYLFYADARTRYEGLDLWYRIEQFFPVRELSKAGMILLGATLLLLCASAAQAQDRLKTVQKAYRDVAVIGKEMSSANPYPGGRHWRKSLYQVAQKLDADGDAAQGPYRWFYDAVETLGQGNRREDLNTVLHLEQRLRTITDSLSRPVPPPPAKQNSMTSDQIRNLVPPLDERDDVQKPDRNKDEHKDKPVKKDEDLLDQQGGQGGFGGRRSSLGVVPAVSIGAGLGQVLLYFLIALLVAVVGAALALAVREMLRNRKRLGPKSQGKVQPAAEEFLENPDQENVPSLWRRADELAREGRYLDALRTLYLAVLAMLHQAHLIRYERTRTNGEYADQLRSRLALHQLFLNVTGIFELKWYGERACATGDYQTCRDLADRLQQQMQTALANEK